MKWKDKKFRRDIKEEIKAKLFERCPSRSKSLVISLISSEVFRLRYDSPGSFTYIQLAYICSKDGACYYHAYATSEGYEKFRIVVIKIR